MAKIFLFFIVIIITGLFFLSIDYNPPEKFDYGVSFSKFHSDELGLDWKETYLAILNDLNVKKFRFTAHWPLTEPEEGKFNFVELDFQVQEAQRAGASVILAIGRRLPGWPECHEPDWAKDYSTEEKHEKINAYIKTVIERYKNYENIIYWQVENEPYLTFFGLNCGELNEDFLKEEIKLVSSLDPSRPIIITDSGEFGTWYKAYQRGDVFGTSMYLYVWWRNYIGPIRYPITPGFFRIKRNLVNLIYGKKPSLVIELSAEPWLLEPIVDTSIEVQLGRMGIDKFNEMIEFSGATSFDIFYLWGAEWWYWMNQNNHPEFWERAQQLFNN